MVYELKAVAKTKTSPRIVSDSVHTPFASVLAFVCVRVRACVRAWGTLVDLDTAAAPDNSSPIGC